MLYAATSPNAVSGAYYGPSGLHNKYPKRVESSKASHDEEIARRLWQVSSELTGVKFSIQKRALLKPTRNLTPREMENLIRDVAKPASQATRI